MTFMEDYKKWGVYLVPIKGDLLTFYTIGVFLHILGPCVEYKNIHETHPESAVASLRKGLEATMRERGETILCYKFNSHTNQSRKH